MCDGWLICGEIGICRIDVVGMICAIINGLVQSGGNDEMLSSCLQILGSFALW